MTGLLFLRRGPPTADEFRLILPPFQHPDAQVHEVGQDLQRTFHVIRRNLFVPRIIAQDRRHGFRPKEAFFRESLGVAVGRRMPGEPGLTEEAFMVRIAIIQAQGLGGLGWFFRYGMLLSVILASRSSLLAVVIDPDLSAFLLRG
jgi:hypothetical protein